MVVAAAAAEREAEERGRGRVGDVVQDLLPPLLQVDRVVFVREVAQEAGGDDRVGVAGEQFVAGELFLDEPVERLVGVEALE